MPNKLIIVFLVVGIGIASCVAAVLGGIFPGKLEFERFLQQDERTNNSPEDPSAQKDPEKEPSEGAVDLGDTPGLVQTGAASNSTLSNGTSTIQLTLDSKAISIMSKIDSEMDALSNELGKSQPAFQQADFDLAMNSLEDARVKMSKIVGHQRQFLVVLEGSREELADSSSAAGNNTESAQDWRTFYGQAITTSRLHLTVFEDIIDMIDDLSDLTSESKQLLSLDTHDESDVAQLEEKYHDRFVATYQKDLSKLVNLQETEGKSNYNSSITAGTIDVIEKLNTLFNDDLKLLESLPEDENTTDFQSMYTSPEDLARLDELRQYALERINEDRESFGLLPVELGSNTAAQMHAEDVFKTGKISHWMTNGEKPYMTYTRTGGTGSVFQNVAVGGYPNYQSCLLDLSRDCKKFDPLESIDTLEYEMVYNDVECCDDGHKYNIVDVHHDHVSIGLAYNDYFLVIVQNFENNYIDLERPIFNDFDNQGTLVNITGDLSEDYRIFGITISYDELPTQSVYALNKDKDHYDSGELVAVVQPNNQPIHYDEQFYLEDDYSSIEAKTWIDGSNTFSIEFDLSEIKNDEGSGTKDGVYTILVWVEDPWNGDLFEAITYSVFVK
jgi:uncharacterized protein YkwD